MAYPAAVTQGDGMYVYFIRSCDNANLVKIGYANNVAGRLAALQTGSSSRLEELASFQCKSPRHAASVEAMLHSAFAHLRVRGEWFRQSQDLRAYAAAMKCGDETAAAAALEANRLKRKREIYHRH